MSIRARIPAISRDIDVMVDDLLSPELKSRTLVGFAREALSDAQETNRAALGRVPEHRTFVDGRASEDLEAVRPDGKIVFEFELIEQVLEWIGEELVKASPVLTGTYARSHAVYADGIEQEPGSVSLNAEEWTFINIVPYARKIEHGQSPQAPDGVYDAIAAVAARRFGNLAKIKFTYRAVLGGMQVSQGRAGSFGQSWWLGGAPARSATGVIEKDIAQRFGKTAHNKPRVRYPAIVVTL